MKKKQILPVFMVFAASMVACKSDEKTAENPFLSEYETPFGVPPFDKIKNEHFKPAFDEAFKQHNAEIQAIVQNSDAPTFDNTILAYENSGKLLNQVGTVFGNLNSANTNDELKALDIELAPISSAHRDNIALNDTLFNRIQSVWENRDQFDLNEEQFKLLENTYKSFVRSGANLTAEDKERLREINSRLSVLTVQFGQNVLAETNSFELVVDNEADLAGLPEGLRSAAADEAKARGHEGKWVFTLQNPSVMPFLQYADNRDLRRQLWEGYKNRGNNGNAHDNNEVLNEMVNLRLERANLLGYPTHAHYVLEEAMAENPDNVYNLLNDLWKPALAKAKTEAYDIKKEIEASGESFDPEPYDWRYYTEKIRQNRYAIDEAELKPYFSLENVTQGAFDVANKLFGLSFKRLDGVPVYHEEVEVYEVFDQDGSHLGLLYADFFPRASKRGGAWMTSYRKQETENGARIAPIISIVCNFTKPVGDQPALLTFDEANTLFHEFGHALHGLMSNVTYRSLSGTSVSRDFVELPSQIMENWAGHSDVLKMYAKHYETGEPIPDELIQKLEDAGTFNQGFATLEYLASSFVDMDYHTRTTPVNESADTFEANSLGKIGMISEIIPRHRSTHFTHIFAGGYSAGYYSYIWAEVLDADAFAAFKETSLFDRATADAFRKNILERGGTEKPSVLYQKFRGKDPDPIHLMNNRGLN